jgi:hypothetical protein
MRGEGETSYWRPGWWLLLKLDTACFGLSACAHRSFCLALHLVLVLAVQELVTRRSASAWAGFLAALLVAANPAPIEAVTWMAAATNVLPAAGLILASGVAWLAYLERGGPRRALGALVLLALSLGFREAAYHLPLVFLVGWLCVRGMPRRWSEGRALGLVLASALVMVLAHYAWLTAREGPAPTDLLARTLAGALGFAGAFAPIGIDARVLLAAFTTSVAVLFLFASPAARYFLVWGCTATFPYVCLGYGSRFAYFAALLLPIGVVLAARDVAARLGHAARAGTVLLGLALAAGQAQAFGPALAPFLEKPRSCARVLEFARDVHLERFERLGVGLLPRVVSPGFDALLALYLGRSIEVVNARIVPRPPFAVHVQPLPPEGPGTGFLAFDGDQGRLVSRAELFQGLVPLQLVSFRQRWRVAPDEQEALRLVRSRAVDAGAEVVLLEPPRLPYSSEDPPARLVRWERTAEGLLLEVDCPASAILVLGLERRGEPEILVDGEPGRAIQAFGRFEAVELPAGTRRVEWRGPVDV